MGWCLDRWLMVNSSFAGNMPIENYQPGPTITVLHLLTGGWMSHSDQSVREMLRLGELFFL